MDKKQTAVDFTRCRKSLDFVEALCTEVGGADFSEKDRAWLLRELRLFQIRLVRVFMLDWNRWVRFYDLRGCDFDLNQGTEYSSLRGIARFAWDLNGLSEYEKRIKGRSYQCILDSETYRTNYGIYVGLPLSFLD